MTANEYSSIQANFIHSDYRDLICGGDIFEKMAAAGFNTVSCYFDWGYHSPAPGVYDFSGVRNLDKFLDAAAEAGFYVIARPGPRISQRRDG